MNDTERCLSDLVLDRHLANELGEPEAAEVTAHLSSCASCQRRADVLRHERLEFAQSPALGRELDAIERRARPSRILPLSAMALAAALMLAFLLPRPDEVRTKGGLAIDVIARHAGTEKVETLLPGAKVAPGDAIRFRYTSAEKGFLTISAIDSAQVVSIYHRSEAIEGGSKLIDGSIILDGTLGPEQIVAVVCPQPLDDAAVLAAAHRALDHHDGDPRKVAELELECAQAFFLIEKVSE